MYSLLGPERRKRQRAGREQASPMLVYVGLPCDLGDGFTEQTSGTLCPTGDRSELVGGEVSCRHAWGSHI